MVVAIFTAATENKYNGPFFDFSLGRFFVTIALGQNVFILILPINWSEQFEFNWAFT